MEPFNNIKEIWHTSNDERTGSPLVTAKLELIVKKRIKRQKKILAGYFWASFFYQVLIYSFLSHFIIRFWNDWRFVILSVIGICLYVPFTILFMKKYKLMLNPPAAVSENISANVQHQYNSLSAFFRFKRRFDLLAVPLSCFIITAFLMEYYAQGGMASHLLVTAVLFVGWLLLFMTATWFENVKKFRRPLYHLEAILNDIRNS